MSKDSSAQAATGVVRESFVKVREQVDDAAEDLKDRLEHAAESVKGQIDRATEAAADFFHETRRTVQRQVRQSREAIEDFGYEVEYQIRRHPVKSVAIALGAGVVLGWALGQVLRKRD